MAMVEPGTEGDGGGAADSVGAVADAPAKRLGIMGQSAADGGGRGGIEALRETQSTVRHGTMDGEDGIDLGTWSISRARKAEKAGEKMNIGPVPFSVS